MTPETLFHQMLGLGNQWRVKSSTFEPESSLVILQIEETPQLIPTLKCPDDGAEVFCYDHTEELGWRHLNVFEHRCEIRCRLPRVKCRKCGKIRRVTPPWEGLSKHFTQAFEAMALVLIREMPMARVAEIVKESDTRLWRMLFQHVDLAYRAKDMSEVTAVGVDEMCIRKGREYLTVFADILQRQVLFATEGRDFTTWERFIQEYEQHEGHRHQLTQVSMDMCKPYMKGVAEWCRNAKVIFDKYHVIAQVNKAVDETRKYESRYGGEQQRWDLRKTLWLWRKNPENLTEAERTRLAKIDRKYLLTGKAYQMRLVLQEIYRTPDRARAKRRFLAWARWVQWIARKYPLQAFGALVGTANMVVRHIEGILEHWNGKITNAFMEGLNSVFSATKRKARGYRTTNYLICMLYVVAAKLRIPFH